MINDRNIDFELKHRNRKRNSVEKSLFLKLKMMKKESISYRTKKIDFNSVFPWESKNDENSVNESYGETDNRFFASRRKIDLFFEQIFNRSKLVN